MDLSFKTTSEAFHRRKQQRNKVRRAEQVAQWATWEQGTAAAVCAGQKGVSAPAWKPTLNWIFISQMECFGEQGVSVTLRESREICIKRRIDIHSALSSCDRLITYQTPGLCFIWICQRAHSPCSSNTHLRIQHTLNQTLSIMTYLKSNLVWSVWSASDGVDLHIY